MDLLLGCCFCYVLDLLFGLSVCLVGLVCVWFIWSCLLFAVFACLLWFTCNCAICWICFVVSAYCWFALWRCLGFIVLCLLSLLLVVLLPLFGVCILLFVFVLIAACLFGWVNHLLVSGLGLVFCLFWVCCCCVCASVFFAFDLQPNVVYWLTVRGLLDGWLWLFRWLFGVCLNVCALVFGWFGCVASSWCLWFFLWLWVIT